MLLRELADADATAVERAPKAVATLPSFSECADPVAVAARARADGGLGPEGHAQLDAIATELPQVRARWSLGRYDAGLEQAKALLAQAEALPHRSSAARVRYEVARLQASEGELDSARTSMEAAYFAAERLGLDRTTIGTSPDDRSCLSLFRQ
ncbi:MAG: hypothetical protein AB1Z98_27125 [Nannocystaceae bacterium]